MKKIKILIPLLFSILNVNIAFGHGSVISPASRAVKCGYSDGREPLNPPGCIQAGNNMWGVENCSVYFEGIKPYTDDERCEDKSRKDSLAGFPSAWNASVGGDVFAPLNDQNFGWDKTSFSSGSNQIIKWKFTANHATRWIKFYLTKENWSQGPTLSRENFDLDSPLKCDIRLKESNGSVWSNCSEEDGENCGFNTNNEWPCPQGKTCPPTLNFNSFQIQPPQDTPVEFSCEIPERKGYHILLSVWAVSNTPMSFYSVSDLMFDGNGGTPEDSYPHKIKAISGTSTLSAGTEIKINFLSDDTSVVGSESIKLNKETTAAEWQEQLAQQINMKADTYKVKAGQKGTDNIIRPVQTENGNTIYAARDSSVKNFTLEFTDTGNGEDDFITINSLNDINTPYIIDASTGTVSLYFRYASQSNNEVKLSLSLLNNTEIVAALESPIIISKKESNSYTWKIAKIPAGTYTLVFIAEETHSEDKTQQISHEIKVENESDPDKCVSL